MVGTGQVGSSRADWPLRGAYGGRVQRDTVVSHSQSRKQFKGWRAGKVQAAAVEHVVDVSVPQVVGQFFVVTNTGWPARPGPLS